MNTVRETVDVVVAGGGTAGHIAALQAARAGAKTSIIEAGSMLAGTMTAGGVNMPNHFFSSSGPVVLGIPWELYTKSKQVEGLSIPDYTKRRPVESPGYYSYINIPIYVALAEEESAKAGVIIHYHEFIADVKAIGDFWEITSLGRGIQRITKTREIIDATGDSDVLRILGMEVLRDDVRQPGSYQYKIEDIEHEQIWEKEVQQIYEEAMGSGELQQGDFAYPNMLPFKYYLDHGGHNGTHIYQSDTSDAEGQTAANLEGRARMLRMFKFIKNSIPGGERAVLKTMYPRAVARETYRAKGEYIITQEDFLQAVDFEDKVCNAFNYIDMHSQERGCDVYFHDSPELLPKIPFRALIPKDSARITVAGRIVSAHRVALAGIRAQCICMAMGQAMGAAAALAVKQKIPSREVSAKDIVALTMEHGAAPV
ncbi:MAG: FAD-dependent oxidoreductase [Ardenticatenaceae bacterium]|nr:FAD-dependent oxidoreductase [Ardenticatenaceae bacterium]MCB9444627.1 FAD-dependent oxidoreductase [Ardenticatenaceae bacterium]